nr:gag pol polyprotein [Hymenolepis microstoma]
MCDCAKCVCKEHDTNVAELKNSMRARTYWKERRVTYPVDNKCDRAADHVRERVRPWAQGPSANQQSIVTAWSKLPKLLLMTKLHVSYAQPKDLATEITKDKLRLIRVAIHYTIVDPNELTSAELLAIYLAVKNFPYILDGRQITIFIDHNPLICAIRAPTIHHSPREIRHLDFVLQFANDIRYIDGLSNAVANAISLMEVDQIDVSPLDLQELDSKRRQIQNLRQSLQTLFDILNAYSIRLLTPVSMVTFQPPSRDLLFPSTSPEDLRLFPWIFAPKSSSQVKLFNHILTRIDSFTRWRLEIPQRDNSYESVAKIPVES